MGHLHLPAPAAETHLVTFRYSELITYNGMPGQTFSSWWTRHKILATSNGSSTGTVEVRPHDLYNRGASFSVYLEP